MEHTGTAVARLASEARTDELIEEVERYLGAVDVFRELGHEPYWRPEGPSTLVTRITAWLDTRESQMSGV